MDRYSFSKLLVFVWLLCETFFVNADDIFLNATSRFCRNAFSFMTHSRHLCTRRKHTHMHTFCTLYFRSRRTQICTRDGSTSSWQSNQRECHTRDTRVRIDNICSIAAQSQTVALDFGWLLVACGASAQRTSYSPRLPAHIRNAILNASPTRRTVSVSHNCELCTHEHAHAQHFAHLAHFTQALCACIVNATQRRARA